MSVQRRKRQRKTDYKTRLKMVASGKLRIVTRLSLKNVSMQIVEYGNNGDKIITSAHSNELKKYGWLYNRANISSAYLVGLLLAIKAKKIKIKEAIFDCGLKKTFSGGVLFAALKGVVDGGLDVPCNDEVFPSEERIRGKHIADYVKSLKKEDYEKRFGNYLKLNARPEDIEKKFAEVKDKITRG